MKLPKSVTTLLINTLYIITGQSLTVLWWPQTRGHVLEAPSWWPHPGGHVLVATSWWPHPSGQNPASPSWWPHPGGHILAATSWWPHLDGHVLAAPSWWPYPGGHFQVTKSWQLRPGGRDLTSPSWWPCMVSTSGGHVLVATSWQPCPESSQYTCRTPPRELWKDVLLHSPPKNPWCLPRRPCGSSSLLAWVSRACWSVATCRVLHCSAAT